MSRYVASILEESEFRILASLSGLHELQQWLPDTSPALCIIGSATPALPELCAFLRTRFPDSHLVLIDADELDEPAALAREADLDGCLSVDLAPQLLLAGLRLVIEGTQCFPKTGGNTDGKTNGNIDGKTSGQSPCNVAQQGSKVSEKQSASLTPREKAVLSLIGEGLANKVIARELDISESTVKAHLNSVLRKTGTTNRTQAARWSFEHSADRA